MEGKLKLAILDMYEGTRNLGMTNIQDIVRRFGTDIDYEIFDVRSAVKVPDLGHDIYIFSGGPGNPLMGDESWLTPFHDLIDDLWHYNLNPDSYRDGPKKFVFFICHSFQMACHHFKIGEIDRRRKKSFGTFPVHKTDDGEMEWLFDNLNEPFWVADFREFQIIQPDFARMDELGIKLLCIEKDRPHLELERAMMAVRFSPEMIGTQFHPEADPVGMRAYFSEPERMAAILEEYGEDKYRNMVTHLHDPDKIARTHATILPLFLHDAIRKVRAGGLVLA
ncbi:MAG: GMP synthase [Saprospiraceae bacterium]|jgi:GMP synthase-like glutamine amidotransferase|nr:GMP synthase [Saprospiraceae bacterium]